MAKKTLTDKIGKRAGGGGSSGTGGGGGGGGSHAHAQHDDEADFDPLLTGDLSRCNSSDFGDGDAAAAVSAVAAAAAASAGGGGGAVMPQSASASGRGSGAAAAVAVGKDSGSLSLQERHLVPVASVRMGMGRFAFLLETCAPGSVPDPLLISALLDLVRTPSVITVESMLTTMNNIFLFQPRAPVITRACYLLECANFVHQCNRGQWPTWLKMNLPAYRPSRGQVLSTQPVQRRLQILQLQASKMFHQWAEVRDKKQFCLNKTDESINRRFAISRCFQVAWRKRFCRSSRSSPW